MSDNLKESLFEDFSRELHEVVNKYRKALLELCPDEILTEVSIDMTDATTLEDAIRGKATIIPGLTRIEMEPVEDYLESLNCCY